MSMTSLESLQNEIHALQERNARVEAEKAWETSIARIFAVGILTYVVILLAMFSLHIDRPYTSAIIPTASFLLSTLSLPFLKRHWISRRNQTL